MSNTILDLLNHLRVKSTAFVGKNLASPWGVEIDQHTDLARFHIVISGSTYIGTTDNVELLSAGDVAIIPNGKAHFYADKLGRQLKPTNFPNGPCNSYFQQYHKDASNTHLLCGYFEVSKSTPPAITSCLPEMLIGRAKDPALAKKFSMVIALLVEELANPDNQSQANLNRLTEILCIYAIQGWVSQCITEDQQLRALADPKTKLVLDKVHERPDAPWTVDSLARHFGQSRTAFAAHFKKATGMSPMHYVRRWRINLACGMLEENALSIDEIAYKSGYADTNAFNRAFKRETGSSPGVYKRMATPD